MFLFFRRSKLLQLINIRTLESQALEYPCLKSHFRSHPPSSFFQFLQNGCGVPPARALQVSQRYARKPRNADSVLAFLKTNGFSDVRIKFMIGMAPRLLWMNPESTLHPKIQFFKDKGISDSDIVEVIAVRPSILMSSLERSIKPSFNFLLTHLGTNAGVIRSMRRSRFDLNLRTRVIPNLEALKRCCVPDYRISRLIMIHPAVLMIKADQFDETVKMTLEMGFNPSSHAFVEAIRVMTNLSRKAWEMKFEIFRSFGWSDKEIMLAFRGHPSFMMASNEKIRKGMNFFIDKLGWSPSYIASRPELVSLSLEKRILPRQRFLEALAAKGLIAKDKMFKRESYRLSKKRFFENYVVNFKVEFPEIRKLYEGIMDGNDQDVKDEA